MKTGITTTNYPGKKLKGYVTIDTLHSNKITIGIRITIDNWSEVKEAVDEVVARHKIAIELTKELT